MKTPEIEKEKRCSLCGAALIYYPPTKQGANNFFWKCPDCGAEIWPENLSVTKQIRQSMYPGIKAKKKGGGSRTKRRAKKQMKFVPWYQKFRE